MREIAADDKTLTRSNSTLSPSHTVTDLQNEAFEKKSDDSNHNHLPAESTLGAVEKGREDRGEVDHRNHKPNALSSLPPVKKAMLLLFFVSFTTSPHQPLLYLHRIPYRLTIIRLTLVYGDVY